MFDEFKNAFKKRDNAVVQLIIINVVIFLLLVLVSFIGKKAGITPITDTLYNQFSIPPTFPEFFTRPWTLITYMFAHDRNGIFHILFNMLGLFWFGKLFVEYLGSDKLVALYILGGLAGGIAYLLVFNTIPYFIDRSGFSGMVGASAAIYAIAIGAATLVPEYTFLLMFFGPVKIKYIALFYVLISFIGTTQENAGGNVAHLGGALMGFIYIKQLQSGINWGGWITSTLDWFKGLFDGKPRVKVTYRKTEPVTSSPKAAASKAAKASQEEIDAILDKISDRGYESLTKDEKEKLFNASKK